jgi:hypothetical protein
MEVKLPLLLACILAGTALVMRLRVDRLCADLRSQLAPYEHKRTVLDINDTVTVTKTTPLPPDKRPRLTSKPDVARMEAV